MQTKTLREAIHLVLRDANGPLSVREIAAEVNARRLWLRPSDGRRVPSSEISSYVRGPRYRDEFSISPDLLITSAVVEAANRTDAALSEGQVAQLHSLIGQAVLAAAALEHVLRLAILHLRLARLATSTSHPATKRFFKLRVHEI